MKITSVSLPHELTDRIDQVARESERSRSWLIRKMLERALTGQERLEALQQIANAELEDHEMPMNDKLSTTPGGVQLTKELSPGSTLPPRGER
jgi:metal-responsive CopG/Arc/MetJ family transcriptional regulator